MEFQTDEKIMTSSVEMVVKEEILFIRVLPGAELNQDTSIVNTLVMEKFFGEKKYPVLVDASSDFTVETQGLSYWASERANRNRKAVAIFTTIEKKQIFQELIKILPLRHAVPLRFFSSKEEGLNWLKDYE